MQALAACLALTGTLAASPAFAGFVSGSDGSDVALNCASLGLTDCETVCTSEAPCIVSIDLDTAVDGAWDTTAGGDVTGDGVADGVYDAQQWAVVFKYTSIDIPANVTVSFENHRSGAPVVWLATDSVTIAGAVNLEGKDGVETGIIPNFAEPGPGGFAGAQPGHANVIDGSGGFGPGGAPEADSGNNASYGGLGSACGLANNPVGEIYGNPEIFPLIGGSGGSAGPNSPGAGAGGGAILIASSGSITLTAGSIISAIGGRGLGPNSGPLAGGGSGGAVRLIAGNQIAGSGFILATGGHAGTSSGGCLFAGVGRIRIEGQEAVNLTGTISPTPHIVNTPGSVFPDSSAPKLNVVAIENALALVPEDPSAGILTSDVDIQPASPNVISRVFIEATNIAPGTRVEVRIVPARGPVLTVSSTDLIDAGDGVLTATADVVFPPGRSEIQLRANW